MYLSINLLGFLVRGLFSNPELNNLKEEGSDFVKNEIKKSERADKWINIFALIANIVFLYLLFHFWNFGVMLVAIMIMAGRLPDLLWEIKHGEKMTRAKANLLSKNILFYISAFLPWLSFPVLYYFLNFYKN